MGLVAKTLGWEERGHPSNLSGRELEAWLLNGALPGNSASGVTVNQKTALSSPAMLQGVRLISETVGRVPLGIYQRTDPGRELLRQHPAHQVLQSPNAEITGVELRSMIQGFALTAGNGYAEIVFGGDGRPRELWPIPPHRITPDRGPNNDLRYRVRTPDGADRVLPKENVHHVPGFQRGGILGIDLVERMQEAVGLTLATEKFASAFFGNGSFLSGWLTFPRRLGKEAKDNVRESLERKHTGLDKAHRIGFLEEGMEWVASGVPPEAAQLIETRKFSIEEVARILNVPPHLLHHLERATFNNIEELGIAFVVYSLSNWWTRWEKRIEKRLLLPSERASGLYAKHNANELLRGSPDKRAEFYGSLHKIGVLSANDIRELEEMNPIEGGDRYFIRRDTIPIDAVDELVASLNPVRSETREALRLPPDDVVPIDEGRKAHERRSIGARLDLRSDFLGLFVEAGQTVVKREVDGVRAAIKKAFGGRNSARLRMLLDEFYESHDEFVTDRFISLLRAYGNRVASEAASEADGGVPEDLDGFIDDYAGTMGRRWTGASAGQLRKLIKQTEPDELEEVIEGRLAAWEERRATKEANREVVEAGEAVTTFVYGALGVSTLKWRNTGRESCPLCQRLEGQTVGISDYFVRKGETVKPTDDETAPLTSKINVRHAPLHGGCDCVVVPGNGG